MESNPSSSDISTWRVRLGALAVVAAPALLFGQYLAAVPERRLAFTLAYAATFLFCLWTPPPPAHTGPRDSPWSGPRLVERLGACLGLGLIYVWTTGPSYQGLAIADLDGLPTRIALVTAAAAMAAAALAPRISTGRLLAVIVASGLALRGLGLDVAAIDPAVRDMLALVDSAQDHLLDGRHPYAIHAMQRGSEIPLTYLPAMWLAYLPPKLVELDIRWMGVLADLCVVASLWWAAAGPDDERREWAEAAVLTIASVWLFLPSVHWNGLYAEPHVWWGVLALLLGAVVRERWWIVAAMLAVALSTRHYGVIVAPFVLLAMWRHLGWRRMLPRLAICGTLTAVLLVPFVAPDPDAFWFGTLRWLREYGAAHAGWFHGKLGFAGYFYQAGLDGWLLPIQLAGVGTLFAGAVAFGRSSTHRLVAFAGTAYLWFVMFNGIIWDSFYLGAFLFVAFALVAVPPDGAETDDPPSTRVLAASATVVAAALTTGGWLAWTLVTSMSHRGFERAETRLAESLEAGDALIDRSDWHLQFIDGRRVDSSKLPDGVERGDDLFDSFADPTGALSAEHIWAIARPGRNGAYLDRLAEIGSVVERTSVGRYHLLGVDPPDETRLLSNQLDRLEVAYRPDGKSPRAMPRQSGDNEPVWKGDVGIPWLNVRPKTCTHAGDTRRALSAHPTDQGSLVLRWEDLRLGSHLVVAGGIEDRVVVWDRAAVELEVRIDGEPREPLVVRNRRGFQWRAWETPEHAGERADLELRVTTADAAQRWFCLDGVVLGAPDG